MAYIGDRDTEGSPFSWGDRCSTTEQEEAMGLTSSCGGPITRVLLTEGAGCIIEACACSWCGQKGGVEILPPEAEIPEEGYLGDLIDGRPLEAGDECPLLDDDEEECGGRVAVVFWWQDDHRIVEVVACTYCHHYGGVYLRRKVPFGEWMEAASPAEKEGTW